MNWRMLFTLLFVTMLWGSAFPFIKIGLEELSAGGLALLRYGTASLCFIPLLFMTKSRFFPERKDIPAFLVAGIIGITVYHVSLNYGEIKVSAGAASLIVATAPAISAILAFFMLHDRLPWLSWLGIAISFFGVFLIVLGDNQQISFNIYALLVLLTAISGALFGVLQKPLLEHYTAMEVSAFACWAGTLPMLVFLPDFLATAPEASASVLLSGVYLGVFPAAIAYALFSQMIAKLPVTIAMSFIYIVPVFGLLFAWLLLGEVPTGLTFAGGGIVIVGVVLVSYAKQRMQRRQKRLAPA